MLMEQMRRGALDLVFAAMPVQVDGIRNYALPSLEMVFVGRVRPTARRVSASEPNPRFMVCVGD